MKEWPMLFVKTAGGAINYWQIWTEGSKVCSRWGKVGTENELSDAYEAEGKNIGRSNETSPEEQAISEAQSKFDKQLRLKYCRTLEEASSGLNIKPMRAYVFDDKRAKKIKWPVHVQPKYNGVRCMAYNLPDGSVRLMSRGGKDYTLPHVQQELTGKIPAGWCLDGELYVHGMSLQTTRHHIETYSEESLQVQLVCYDCTDIPPNGAEWIERLTLLQTWFSQNGLFNYVRFSETAIAGDIEAVKEAHDHWTAQGYEGAMIRTMQGKYRLAAKSTDLLKYKMFQDDEFLVVDWTTGKDGVVIYRCEQEDGQTFDVRPMGNENERAELLKTAEASVGQLLTVRFQERSNDNIPIFPVGVGFRPTKDMD